MINTGLYGTFGYFFPGDIVRTRTGKVDWTVVEKHDDKTVTLKHTLEGYLKRVRALDYRAV